MQNVEKDFANCGTNKRQSGVFELAESDDTSQHVSRQIFSSATESRNSLSTGVCSIGSDDDRCWLGKKTFQALIVQESVSSRRDNLSLRNIYKEKWMDYPYELCYHDLVAAEDPSPTDTEDFRSLLFRRIGKIHLRGLDEEWENLRAVLKRHARCGKQANPAIEKSLEIQSSPKEQDDGGVPVRTYPTSSSHSDSTDTAVGGRDDASTEAMPESTSPASIPNIAMDYHQAQKNRAVQSNCQVEDWHYTSELKMEGDQRAIEPKYETKRVSYTPPRFLVTVIFGDLVVSGDKDSTKKGAKHKASKAAWLELGRPLLES